ncbi:MAG: hypothetical protein OEN50_17775 [Deltaproteobacteria bacterium]|nr:hypothetical protein [Deltaproteobacteria bacterium]
MLEILFGFLLYFIPTVATALILSRNQQLKSVALIVFFGAPLLGELTFLMLSRQHPVNIVTNVDFWQTVVSYYPMALFPIGLWATFLAVGAISTLKPDRRNYNPHFLLLGGSSIGGGVGLAFMCFYTSLAMTIHGNSGSEGDLIASAISGLIGGIFSGLVCGGFILRSQRKPQD